MELGRRTNRAQQPWRHSKRRCSKTRDRILFGHQACPNRPVQDAYRSRDSQPTASCDRTALSFITQHGVGAEHQAQRNHFSLAGVELAELRVNLRGRAPILRSIRGRSVRTTRGRSSLWIDAYSLDEAIKDGFLVPPQAVLSAYAQPLVVPQLLHL